MPAPASLARTPGTYQGWAAPDSVPKQGGANIEGAAPPPRGQVVRTRFKPCSAVFAPVSLGKSYPSPASVSLCKDSCTFLMWWAIRCRGHAGASTVPCFTWPPERAPLPPKTSSQHQICSLGELPPSLPCAILGHQLYAGCLTSQNTAWCLPG